MKCNGYTGKVKPGGAQYVKAPFPNSTGKSPKIKTGEDLRTGKKK